MAVQAARARELQEMLRLKMLAGSVAGRGGIGTSIALWLFSSLRAPGLCTMGCGMAPHTSLRVFFTNANNKKATLKARLIFIQNLLLWNRKRCHKLEPQWALIKMSPSAQSPDQAVRPGQGGKLTSLW